MPRQPENTEKLYVWVPRAVRQWLEEKAEGLPLSLFVRRLILEKIQQEQPPSKKKGKLKGGT